MFQRKAKFHTKSNYSKSIGHIMDARYRKGEVTNGFSVSDTVKRTVSKFVKYNVFCLIVSCSFQPIGNDFAGKILCDFFIIRDLTVDDQCSVSRKLLGKQAERMPDIIQIFEEIKMICINIQDDTDFGEKAQETIRIFTGFCNKSFRSTYTDISMDSRKDSAYRNSRIGIGFQENMRNHRSGSRFSMGS